MRPLLAIAAVLVVAFPAFAREGYYRHPAIFEDTLVFTAEGDLWRVSVSGGTAVRMTSHAGEESRGAISPDGAWVAFSASYDGPEEVFVMPLAGGVPKPLTCEGERARVVGWTPGGEVLYATRHHSTLPQWQMAAVHPRTGRSRVYPLHQASDGCVGAGTLFFNRFAPTSSSTKRYRGGMAQDVWRFADGDTEAACLTADFDGADRSPRWWAGRVLFVSDRDGVMNLWSMAQDGSDLRQHTTHTDFDAKDPEISGDRVVYQHGADLRVQDLVTGEDWRVEGSLPSDFERSRSRWVTDPMEYLTSAHVSPDGEQVALTARGRVFVAPAAAGRIVTVTPDGGARWRSARFLGDGGGLVALSDRTGEVEFHRLDPERPGEAEPLTRDARVFRADGVPSPDGRTLVFDDKNQELWIHDVERGRTERIDTSEEDGFSDFAWSPDSEWLAYVKVAPNHFSRIHLRRIRTGESLALTSDRVNSFSPAWSPDGAWLYFLSDRDLRSLVRNPWGPYQPEPHIDRPTGVYVADLAGGMASPFQEENELTRAAARDEAEAEDDSEEDEDDIKVRIEQAGLPQRIHRVPLESANRRSLATNGERLFWIETATSFDREKSLRSASIESGEAEAVTLAEDMASFELSADGQKLLVRREASLHVVDAGEGVAEALEDGRVDLSGWAIELDPREEWRQMFVEAWRLERDYFYDPALHGIDRDAILGKYLPLVDRVTDRREFADLLRELVGELSASHTYVFGGDIREASEHVGPAFLGATLAPEAKGFRIERIFRSDPDLPERFSPLARPDLDIRSGDVIAAINGVSCEGADDAGAMLRNQAGKQVLLRILPQGKGDARSVVVEPMTAGEERDLRYRDWEESRRLRVEERGSGRVGYVHLRAMGTADYTRWARGFYPVFRREGLVIDARHNRGGNIDSWILEKLLRPAWFFWQGRVGRPTLNMQYAFRGHVVVLCNERTVSDGEILTEGIRRLGIGAIVGTRTQGGEIWLSFNNWLADGGIASAAAWGVFGPEGDWLIEGHGVDPDIVVDNLPHATHLGGDAQLDAAVEHLLARMREDPVEEVTAPPYPDKSFLPE